MERATNRRWNAWATLTTLMLVVSSFWIPVSNAAPQVQARAQIADGIELRVLPIGDFITFGAQSSDDNGYREKLFDKLAARGNKVDFVGGLANGTMADNDHEGPPRLRDRPDLVRKLSGHRLRRQHRTPRRLKRLIDTIYKYSSDAVILLCQIIPASPDRYPRMIARIEDFNEAISGIVSEYVSDGKKMIVVPMHSALSTADLADGLHPNNGGYAKMANAYYAAIEDADERGWISEPGPHTQLPHLSDATGPENCKSTPSWYRVGEIATGAKVANSDGPFIPSWVKKGVVAEGACPRARLHFMDLDGDGLKDYACVDPKTGAVKVHINIPDSEGKTSGNWKTPKTIAKPAEARDGTGVMFADLNGDGRDDYIYVDPDTGDVSAWINRLEKDGVWQWQALGRIAVGVGATNDTPQMVDIDGDGRADFCLVSKKTGEVTAWLNTGTSVMPDYHKIGVIATGASQSDGDTVILGDLTGEGRADYMMVGVGGKVNALINRRQETSLAPRWSQLFNLAAGPDGARSDQVRLVDMTGDGKVDYLLVDEKTGKVTLWENTGTGGKWQPGDGLFLCDLDGDGTSDYFWIDHTGKGYGYLNTGKGENKWNDLGLIAKGDHPREQIRMGVLTKSRRADYIVVDEKTGRADWFQNLGKDGGWGWRARGEFAAGPKNTVETKFGLTFKGKNVRFADLDGDGLDDYLYVSDTGAVIMWRHLGTDPPSWGIPRLVADGVGVLAQDVQFADTNGDGRLDYVVVGRTTGRTRSWHHLGFRDDGSIRWNTPLSFADGVGSIGSAIRMTGDKRADYVSESTAGSSATPVYLDPKVYETPQAKCQPPCILVFPPSSLSSATTISLGSSYTTSLEYGAMGKTTVSGKEVTAFVRATTKITVSIPPITVSKMTYSNVEVTRGQETTKLRPTDRKLPTWTTWPPRIVTPIPEKVDEIEPDDDGTKTPCNLWFFSICIKWGNTKIGGIRWTLPPGIYPPGPPPRHIVDPPGPGWTIKPPLPPWPPITVGHDGKITYPEEPGCETESASLCSTTTFRSETIVGPSTSTVTRVSSDCETIYGCSVSDWETATQTFADSCPLPTPDSKRDLDDATKLEARQFVSSPGCPANAIVYPSDPENVGEVPALLKEYKGKYKTIESSEFNFVAFYWIPMLDNVTMGALLDSPDVEDAYYYEEWNANTGPVDTDLSADPDDDDFFHEYFQADKESNSSSSQPDFLPGGQLDKRARLTQNSPYWALSQVSLPYGKQWKAPDSGSYDASTPNEPYRYHYDDSAGDGQFVYTIHEYGYWDKHPDGWQEFTNAQGTIEVVKPTTDFGPFTAERSLSHGSGVGAMVLGEKLGVCKKCGLVFVTSSEPPPTFINQHLFPRDRILQQFIDALDHIKRNGRKGKAVINMSFGFYPHEIRKSLKKRWRKLLQKLETDMQALLVVSAGNDGAGRGVDRYPGLFAQKDDPYGTLSNMIVVGATNKIGISAGFSQRNTFVRTNAPGSDITVPDDAGGKYAMTYGTSFAAPQVAALAAYYRSIPSPWKTQLGSPANVRKLIMLFQREIINERGNPGWHDIIWNGQVGAKSCLRDYATKGTWDTDNACPTIRDNLEEVPVNPCRTDGTKRKRQDEGDSCPVPPLPGAGDGSGKDIEWTSGQASPKCPSGTCGGTLCKGYYCESKPKGHPPDFYDPKNPDAPNPGPLDPENPSPEPGWDDDDDDDEPSEPSGFAYGIRFSANGCKQDVFQEFGDAASSCGRAGTNARIINSVRAFAKPPLKACFYYNDHCVTETTSDRIVISGGDRFEDDMTCFTIQDDMLISTYKITEGEC
ncbi:hypothetical protein ACJZ2D_001024 [Fusarium nematophilum]